MTHVHYAESPPVALIASLLPQNALIASLLRWCEKLIAIVHWIFITKQTMSMSSIHETFIAKNSKYKYEKCLESCKARKVDFEQFLIAIVKPKDDNSINIYNLVDGMMKRINDVNIAKTQIRSLAEFVRGAEIKNGRYVAHWMRIILNSIMDFDICGGDVGVAREDLHGLCSELAKTNLHDAREKFMFVLQKYGYAKCQRYCCVINSDVLWKMDIELCKEFPVYGYLKSIHIFRQYTWKYVTMTVMKYVEMFEHLLQRVEAYENRQICNALGCMHFELQKRKCDGVCEYVLADEYVVARICKFFS